MSGVIGVNVRTLGVNRDNILAAALTLGGRYILVQDDPALAAQAASAGLKVIYRQSGDETLHLDPAAFVAERAKNAPAAAYIHLTNELDPTPELLAWTNEAMKYADSIRRKLCIFNFSTHRSSTQWGACGSLVQRAVTTGHAVGLHVYLDGRHDDGAFSWQSLKRAAGGQWLVTEFAFIRDVADAYAGWRGTLSAAQYADFCAAWLPTFAREGMPVLLFSFDHWTHNEEGKAHGFGVNDAPNLLNALAVLNARYPIVETTPVPPTSAGMPVPMTVNAPAGLKLRAAPNGDPVLYVMPFGTRVVGYPTTAQRAGAYDWIQVDDDGTRGWAAQVYLTAEVVSAIRNGIDVSQAQASVNWKDAKAGGYDFAFIRATQGIATSLPVGKDTRFTQHIDSALAAGVQVGAYHAFLASISGKAQAAFFYQTVAPYLDRLSFPLAIDVELLNGQTAAALTERLYEMATTLEALTGDKPMIYTSMGFWDGYTTAAHDAYFATLPLWLAQWTTAAAPTLPRTWKRAGKTWTIWQWRVDGDGIPGYQGRIDVNRLKA